MDIAGALREIRTNIAAARERSPLAAQQVKLLAISKTKPLELVREAWRAGQEDFGENKVQELVPKQEALPQARWHLVGHLQTNKVKYLIGRTELIHSLDSLTLAAEIEKRAAAADLLTRCLVQVNIAEEDSKSGLLVPELADFLTALADYPHLRVEGLMTIGPMVDDPEEIRPVFAQLRQLFWREQARNLPHLELRWLSMGMSHDYQVAVEEGANIVRVGSSIFGARYYSRQENG